MNRFVFVVVIEDSSTLKSYGAGVGPEATGYLREDSDTHEIHFKGVPLGFVFCVQVITDALSHLHFPTSRDSADYFLLVSAVHITHLIVKLIDQNSWVLVIQLWNQPKQFGL